MPNVVFTFDGRSEQPFVAIEIPDRHLLYRIRPATRFSCLVEDRSGIHCSLSTSMGDGFAADLSTYANTMMSIIVSGLSPPYVNITISPVARPHSGHTIGIPGSSLRGSLPGDHLWVEGVLRRVGGGSRAG
jgi:hypothetical protein